MEVPNYFKPYGHAGPYFVGMLLGYILVKKPKIVIPRVIYVFFIIPKYKTPFIKIYLKVRLASSEFNLYSEQLIYHANFL